MLPKHHNLKEPFRNDGKNVRLGLSDNRKQVSGSKKRLMVPFICSDFEQIVQKKTNEAISTHSTRRPLLSLPAPTKIENVSIQMAPIQ